MLRFRILLTAFAAACAAPSIHAQICTPFTDVPASDPFCADIQWMLNRGVTFGCHGTGQPPAYCPAQFVRRDQMAAFMFRLSHDVVFQDGGNAFGNPAMLGTTDNQPLEIRVNNARGVYYDTNGNVVAGVNNSTSGSTGVFNGTIAGGRDNLVTADRGTVSGGAANTADFHATVVGGLSNNAAGDYSTVLGGTDNVALGNSSLAAGTFAQANSARCVAISLWGDSPGMPCFGVTGGFNVGAPGGFAFDFGSKRADGGGTRWIAFGRFGGQAISTSTGGFLSDPGGVWVDGSSSREAKTDFEPVDPGAILDKVASLPITTWRYRGGDVRHIGPMAEDFSAAFEVGYGPHTIANLDARGVALAAIQGLNAKHEAERAAKDAEIATLRAELAEIRSLLVGRSSR